MNVNLLQGPGAGADAVGTGGDANAALRRHRAWQSAMEQAQLANWFKPGASTSGAAPGAPQARAATATLLGSRSSQPADSPGTAQATPQEGQLSRSPEEATRATNPEPAKASSTARGTEADAASPPVEAPATERAQPQRNAAHAKSAMTQTRAEAATGGLDAPALPVDRATVPSLPARAAALAGIAGPTATADAPPSSPSSRIEAPSLPLVAAQVGQWLSTPEIEASESTAAADAPAPRMPEQEASDGATRLHVEWTREGARLWLGVDHDQLQRLPTLIGQLQQWLAASGVKLLALVCNGRTVYQARRAYPPSFPPQGDLA